jgi:hypothetical protein
MTQVSGVLALATALVSLAHTNDKTASNVDLATAGSAMDYLNDVVSNTEVLTTDQKKCAVYAELAATQNVSDAIKAAKYSTQCRIDSANMNTIIGNDNANISKENYEQAVQTQNLTPIYACAGQLTLEFVTTSSEIASFHG